MAPLAQLLGLRQRPNLVSTSDRQDIPMPMKKGFLTVEDMSTDEKILALTIERNIITERLAVIIEALARLEAQRETH
jgi:hypothetical protein